MRREEVAFGSVADLTFRFRHNKACTVFSHLGAQQAIEFRAGIMYISDDSDLNPSLKSNMFSLSGIGFFGAVGCSINLGGQTALALRVLLALFSSKMSSSANRPFGDEFRAA
ncbi:hypothetical protein K7X08_020107 [Anisodus acutangulus]|uniref:Uncharacterized protein n=1 Tax=Anisodus acutangulus TaxID=402998 RepID=A0A9Q1REN2_9SOLA|nr:hypothetical protein K7X08_020107 [Anisodus acutangulus]